MLVGGPDRGVLAKVYADTVAHKGLAVECLPDGDGGRNVEEGHDDAAEGFEGGPAVDRGMLIDKVLDLDEVCGVEYLGLEEVCYYEGIGGGGRLDEWRQVRKIQSQWRFVFIPGGLPRGIW